MDTSRISLLDTISYVDVLREIASFNKKLLNSDCRKYDELIVDTIKSLLPYSIDNENMIYYKPLIEILNDLNIYPEITVDNFYLLTRSIKFIRLNIFQECLKNSLDFDCYSVVIHKELFVTTFRQKYGDKYNDVLEKIIELKHFKRGKIYNFD